MKLKYLKAMAMCILLGASNSAIAGLIYDFDVSKQTLDSSTDFLGYSVVIEFSNNTDFNYVTNENIERVGFTFEGVEYSGSNVEFNINGGTNELFSFDSSGDLILTLGSTNHKTDLRWTDGDNYIQLSHSKIGAGQNSTNLVIQHNGDLISAHSQTYTNDFVGVARTSGVPAIPEPSTLAIFAIGMLGLVSRRFKKQS